MASIDLLMGFPIKDVTSKRRHFLKVDHGLADQNENIHCSTEYIRRPPRKTPKPPDFQTQLKATQTSSKRFAFASVFYPIRVWPNDPTIDYKILLIEPKGRWEMPTIEPEGEPLLIPLHPKKVPTPGTPTPSNETDDLFGDVFGDFPDDLASSFDDLFGDSPDDPTSSVDDPFGGSLNNSAPSLDDAFADAFDDPVPLSDDLFEDKKVPEKTKPSPPSPGHPSDPLDDLFWDEEE